MNGLGEELQNVIIPLLKESGVDLVDFHVYQHGGKAFIRILADKPWGGITLQECAHLNRAIGAIIEQKDLMMESYVIEVSSPGVDRALRRKEDFLRTLNRKLQFFLSSPIENKIEYVGILKKVDEEQVLIDLDSRELIIPIDKINKARQMV